VSVSYRYDNRENLLTVKLEEGVEDWTALGKEEVKQHLKALDESSQTRRKKKRKPAAAAGAPQLRQIQRQLSVPWSNNSCHLDSFLVMMLACYNFDPSNLQVLSKVL
jgi:hypothetical protein